VNRRQTVCSGLAFVAAAHAAKATPMAVGFVPLRTAVRVPLAALEAMWTPVTFQARFAKSNGLDALAPGLAFRTGEGVVAHCAYCPHEFCTVGLNAERQELQCPCHGGRFDATRDGARLSGPPPRALYHFQYSVTAMDLEVTGIEAAIERRLL